MPVLKTASFIVAKAFQLVRPAFPPIIRIETTNMCNASCSFCPRDSLSREIGIMSQPLYEKLIDECAAGGVKTLHLHNFGEPLLDPDLADRIKLAKDKGIPRNKIYSNGRLLRNDLAKNLLDSGLDELKISVDGADADEFASVRRGLSLDQILDNLNQLAELRNNGTGNKNIKVTAICTQSSDRERTEKLLAGTVDKVEYSRIHNWGGALNRLGLKKIRKPCIRPFKTMTILWDGQVSLCCLDYNGSEILGDVSGQTISQVWENEHYRKIRRLHELSGQSKNKLCRECSKSFV